VSVSVHFVADVHVANHSRLGGPLKGGRNLRARQTLDVLTRARERADEAGADLVVVGDLFDNPRPSPSIVQGVREALLSSPDLQRPLKSYLLVGNHDQGSTETDHHAMASMKPLPGAVYTRAPQVVEDPLSVWRPGSEVALRLFPFEPRMTGREYVTQALATASTAPPLPTIACVHLGVEDDRTPPWLRGQPDSVRLDHLVPQCIEHGVDGVVVGNWHGHQHWDAEGVKVWQCGALVPTGWSNVSTVDTLGTDADPYGHVVTWDSSRPLTERWGTYTLTGPRYVRASNVTEAVAAIEVGRSRGCPLYVRVQVSPENIPTTSAALEGVEGMGSDCWVEVVPADATRSGEAEKPSPDLEQSAHDLRAAVREYVAALALGDIDPERVCARVGEALQRARG